MNHTEKLTSLMRKPGLIKAPGIYDGLSALLVERSGFEVGFLSGAGIAFSRLGFPDVGLTTASEVAGVISAIRERSNLSLVVDMDTGFGNVLNVGRTVRLFEQAGASALLIEDQVFPKRCGHMAGKQIISIGEMVEKIKCALDARHHGTLVFARTDAIALENFDDVLERAFQYINAGADALFVEGPTSLEQMQIIGNTFGTQIPLIHNLVEGGITPIYGSEDLSMLGYKIALYPLALLHAFVPRAEEILAQIATVGHTLQSDGALVDLNYMNDLLGADDMLNKNE